MRLRWSLLSVALGLRVAAAVVTDRWPLFPPYYFNDARFTDVVAADMLRAWRTGGPYEIVASPSQRAHAAALAGVYWAVGHRPLAGKLVSSACGALTAVMTYEAVLAGFGPAPALLAGSVVALWPSHVFTTSQNFKDPFALFFSWGAFAALLPLLGGAAGRAPARLAAAFLALVLLGFFRAYMLATTAMAVAAGAAWVAVRRPGGRAIALACAATAAAAIPAYLGLKRAAFEGPLKSVWSGPDTENAILVKTYDDASHRSFTPWSPRGLDFTRHKRQQDDQRWAEQHTGRRIATQLFPDARFESWLDVAAFLPKSAFYVLFMPLPGLYSAAGNLGRRLASLENMALLAVCAAAVAGLRRAAWTPGQVALAAFFSMMLGGSSLLEFDLGSAARHKLSYVPALLPFALAEPERRRRGGVRLKVIQVLECGGPGGTGNQVAAICNGLPASEFEVGLVYATRPGSSPESFRGSAPGATKAFHVPQLTREISPARDMAAFAALYALFRRERPDVVHAHSSKAGALARPAALLAGVPRIFYSPHGYGFLQTDRSALSRALYRLAEASVSWIGTIVAVSPSEERLAGSLSWGKPVRTVCDPYLGALPPTRPHRQDGAPTIVGACGRMTAARRPEVFFNLAQRLTDSRNGLRCVWIGGGELQERMRTDLENMNLLGKVEVTGWLPGGQARERLASVDVLVHFSAWDALPNAVLEAMAHGLPVVASDVPGCRDAVVDGVTGFLVQTEQQLLERTLQLVDDETLRKRLGQAGRERIIAAFGQREALASLEALYRSNA